MQFRLFALIPALAAAAFAANANLANIKTVYLLPMTNGIDQYLANRLRAGEVLAVTTDPMAADAILTDAIGPAFERRLADLYPAPAGPEKPGKEGDESEKKESAVRDDARARMSSFRKGRGVVFLVDRRTRQVVWSTHEQNSSASPRDLDRTARRVSDRLKRDYGSK